MSQCRGHAQISDFKRGDRWICSACGKIGKWGPTWGYYGALGCRKCGQEPVIEFVACSDACMKLQSDGKRHEAASVLQGEINQIDADMRVLTERRNSLTRKLERAVK